MTFVEFILFICAMVGLYLLMRPLQRHLEHRLTRLFRSKSRKDEKPIIDITDYKKKGK